MLLKVLLPVFDLSVRYYLLHGDHYTHTGSERGVNFSAVMIELGRITITGFKTVAIMALSYALLSKICGLRVKWSVSYHILSYLLIILLS